MVSRLLRKGAELVLILQLEAVFYGFSNITAGLAGCLLVVPRNESTLGMDVWDRSVFVEIVFFGT